MRVTSGSCRSDSWISCKRSHSAVMTSISCRSVEPRMGWSRTVARLKSFSSMLLQSVPIIPFQLSVRYVYSPNRIKNLKRESTPRGRNPFEDPWTGPFQRRCVLPVKYLSSSQTLRQSHIFPNRRFPLRTMSEVHN